MSFSRRAVRVACVLGVIAAAATVTPSVAMAADVERNATSAGMSVSPMAPKGGPFGVTSVWRTKINRAPVAPNSKALVANLSKQVKDHWGGNAAFNVSRYNTSFYTVGPKQRRVTVKWDDCQGKGTMPSGLHGKGGHFVSVPVPANAVPATGTDASLTIYQPSTDRMWDLWQARKAADGWHACWGGRMDKVSQNPGYFSGPFGTTATGLASAGGSIGIREAKAGRINHALTLQVINAAAGTVSWPAQRSDGNDTSTNAIPEGTRFRLDPSVDVDKLNLHPLAKTVAKTAQTYGFIVSDKAGAVAVVTESGEPMRAATGVNPWGKLMRGTPDYSVMAGFPWDKLQALPKDFGKP